MAPTTDALPINTFRSQPSERSEPRGAPSALFTPTARNKPVRAKEKEDYRPLVTRAKPCRPPTQLVLFFIFLACVLLAGQSMPGTSESLPIGAGWSIAVRDDGNLSRSSSSQGAKRANKNHAPLYSTLHFCANSHCQWGKFVFSDYLGFTKLHGIVPKICAPHFRSKQFTLQSTHEAA